MRKLATDSWGCLPDRICGSGTRALLEVYYYIIEESFLDLESYLLKISLLVTPMRRVASNLLALLNSSTIWYRESCFFLRSSTPLAILVLVLSRESCYRKSSKDNFLFEPRPIWEFWVKAGLRCRGQWSVGRSWALWTTSESYRYRFWGRRLSTWGCGGSLTAKKAVRAWENRLVWRNSFLPSESLIL